MALQTLREACDPTQKEHYWAVVMQEGLANIVLLTNYQQILRQQIERSIPRKRAGSSEADKARSRFFKTVLDSLVRWMDLANTPIANIKPLLLASPGFTASGFQAFIKTQAAMDKTLQGLVGKIIVAHSSSGHLHALGEVLASPAVKSQLSDTKFARESALMDRLMELLRHDDGRAWYGPNEVHRAVEKGAVGRGGGALLVNNALFRSDDVRERKKWSTLR